MGIAHRSELMLHPMQLVGTCPPLAQLCLVSQHITFAFRIKYCTVNFGPSTDYLLAVHLFLSLDPSTPTTFLPSGTPLLSWLGPNPYLLGDDCVVNFPLSIIVPTRGTWLKAHLVNADAFPHTITALLSLEELEAP